MNEAHIRGRAGSSILTAFSSSTSLAVCVEPSCACSDVRRRLTSASFWPGRILIPTTFATPLPFLNTP